MALPDLSHLYQYKATPFPPDYPSDRLTFYSPVDQVHSALLDLVRSTTHSLVLAMYGFYDDDLAQSIHDLIDTDGIFVQLTLDSSQSGGVHERSLLAKQNYPATSIATGRSEHGAIMHMKEGVVDGTDRFSGSTNWSTSGESLQDNELTVIRHPLVCFEARTRIDVIHTDMLQQMAEKEAAKTAAPSSASPPSAM